MKTAKNERVERLREQILVRFRDRWPYSRAEALLAAVDGEDEALRVVERARRVQRRMAK